MTDGRLSRLLLWLGFFCIAFVFMLRLLAGIIPFPTLPMDEHAHYSYTVWLLSHASWWPDFSNFPMVVNGAPTAEPNYLNHPTLFYWLMMPMHRLLEGADPIYLRTLPMLVTLAAYAIYMRMGAFFNFSFRSIALYVLFPFLLCVQILSGFYSNDSFAILGGALACFGSYHWLNNNTIRGARYMLAGLAFASVKLTALLLVGFYVLFILLQQWRSIRTLSRPFILAAIALGALLITPYMIFWLQHGSPAPNTPGQLYMLTHYAAKWGWAQAPHLPFWQWLGTVLGNFADQFPHENERTFIPIILLLASFAIILPRSTTDVPTRITRAAAAATLIVLILNLAFSWHRYVAYGWLRDSFTRYYFPLLPAYGIATTSAILLLCRGLTNLRKRA